MSIYRTAVNNAVTTALVFVALAVFGIFSLLNISINNFPDFDSNVIMVMASYQGASAEDIETNVSKVLENSLNAVEDLKHIQSTSKENISLVMLEFNYGVDIDVATNDVRDKLELVSAQLPDGASSPMIFKFSADMMPIMILSATADADISYNALEKILDDRVATPLARVSGVGTVSVSGAPKREIQIFCDPHKLEAYNLTIAQISQIIAQENRNLPSGSIDIGSNYYTLRVEQEFDTAQEMLDIVVATVNGKSVYLRDIAEVHDTVEERYQEAYAYARKNAQDADRECALIVLQKQAGANTVNVIRDAKKELAKIEKSLPSDIKINIVVDNSRNIINTINSLVETIIITFLVVMLVVFVFLGRWRATFVIITAIPISLLGSIIYLFATGETLNIISMSALSIAIGMVVDDAIVVLENISTHLERGAKPKEAAVHATQEVGISVIASTLTMLAVFLPLTMVKGMAGIMFKQLGWIVSIIMIISTTGALTLVPMMCSKMLKAGPKKGKLHNMVFGPINKVLDAISAAYAKLISWCTGHRSITVLTGVAIFAAVLIFLGPKVETEFFPKSDEGRLSATIELPIGTEQSITRDFAHEIYERFTEAAPELLTLSYSLGQADSENAWASMQQSGTHRISMNMDLGSKEDRQRSTGEIAQIFRDILNEYPNIKKYQIKEGGGGMGGQTSIDVEIYGYSFETTDRIAAHLIENIKATGKFAEVVSARDEYAPELQVDFDRVKLARNGLNSTTAASYLSACMGGSVMSYLREDGEEYKIRVRYPKEYRQSIEDIENIILYNNAGKAVRIKDVGQVVESETPPNIVRLDRERMLKLSCIVGNDVALSEAVTAVNGVIDSSEIPSELQILVTGDYEDQQETFGDLIMLMVLIVLLVYMVMASQFESFMSPFVIMFSIPFAFTGVILGSVVTGTPIGVMGMIGIIILLGIVVKNGIVLIDYTILMRERGYSIVDATVAAAKSRLRPILMTTLTTVLGMVPMAIGRGEGAEMWNSLGVTVIWGLSISTLITLVLIPVIYCIFAGIQEKNRIKRAARQAEKAAKIARGEQTLFS